MRDDETSGTEQCRGSQEETPAPRNPPTDDHLDTEGPKTHREALGGRLQGRPDGRPAVAASTSNASTPSCEEVIAQILRRRAPWSGSVHRFRAPMTSETEPRLRELELLLYAREGHKLIRASLVESAAQWVLDDPDQFLVRVPSDVATWEISGRIATDKWDELDALVYASSNRPPVTRAIGVAVTRLIELLLAHLREESTS